jgi:thiamine-phosphate pyrophosphorylase
LDPSLVELLTPAASRALEAAAQALVRPESDEVGLPHLLAGLLAEPESSAAQWLERHGIDRSRVETRFAEVGPEVASTNGLPGKLALSEELQSALMEARRYCQPALIPETLASQHLLLGLFSVRGAVTDWIAEQGCDVSQAVTDLEQIGRPHAPVLESAGPTETEVALESVLKSAPRLEPMADSGDGLALSEGATLRIIDAVANRTGEAIRTIEDIARFGLNEALLTERYKHLRHDLQSALTLFTTEHLLAARNVAGDVGTRISTPAERVRADIGHVLRAANKRLQEGLRTLEEMCKLAEPEVAGRIEGLRYRAYQLESALAATRQGLVRLADARLYVLVDGAENEARFAARAAELIHAGVDVLQLRDKRLDDRQLLGRAKLLRELTRRSRTLFVMNDRADLALLADADGIHVGQEELSVSEVRAIVGPGMLIGVSTHSVEQAEQAVLDGANYVGVGPTFPSGTKSFDQYPGLELLRAVAGRVSLPAFAIGGITSENLATVLGCGMSRVAIGGGITATPEPGVTAADLKARLALQHPRKEN